ncbi:MULTISPECIES: MFS transporter [unclassified Streptomyces]|uniref:MFS transporter n=1 Tax=unclassified Streptomyces TaxID=2593676 RepID=UPI002365450C|nr:MULTISPECIES: MFS transporter [unclassified Streptomyces]MDF3142600.1 MFS transporter [Streptomyces sp. T21Q-yed]WDF42324.1 MFS transporter [Streptomyces sp. T12]
MPGSVPSPTAVDVDDAAASPVPVSGPAHLLRVTLLMAGSCLPILGAVLIAPVLPKMQDHFASTPGAKALVPLALTVPALSLALLAPFAGVIVDRLGRKRLLIITTVLYAVFGTAPLCLDSLGAVIASRALVGVAEAAIMTCCTTLIGDYYSGHRRVKYLALQTMCASASATVFFVIGGAAGSAGWRVPFWIYAVSLALAPLMASALPGPAARPAHAAGDETPAEAAGPKVHRPFPWRQLAGICALTFFGAMVFYTVPVEMAYLLDDLGVASSGVIGLATAIASAATVGGAITFARLKRAPDPMLPAVFAVCAAGFGVMFLAGNTPLLVVGAVINCLGTGMLLPALLTSAMSRLAFEDRGRGTGLWMAAFFGGEFVCPLVLLAGESAVGSLAGAVGMLGVAAALVAAGLWAAAPARRSPQPNDNPSWHAQ